MQLGKGRARSLETRRMIAKWTRAGGRHLQVQRAQTRGGKGKAIDRAPRGLRQTQHKAGWRWRGKVEVEVAGLLPFQGLRYGSAEPALLLHPRSISHPHNLAHCAPARCLGHAAFGDACPAACPAAGPACFSLRASAPSHTSSHARAVCSHPCFPARHKRFQSSRLLRPHFSTQRARHGASTRHAAQRHTRNTLEGFPNGQRVLDGGSAHVSESSAGRYCGG